MQTSRSRSLSVAGSASDLSTTLWVSGVRAAAQQGVRLSCISI
jgi:hypothetical protein